MIVLGSGLSNFDYLYEALPKALTASPRYGQQKFQQLKRNRNTAILGGVRGAAALFFNQIIPTN